jgi:hypothetical protein
MNRWTKTALAVTGAAALSLTGLPSASAHDSHHELYKVVGEWVSIDGDTTVFPAGTACKHEVKAKERGAYRDTLYFKNKADSTNPEARPVKVFEEFTNNSTVKFSAHTKKHGHKSIKLNAGGDFRIKVKGDDIRVRGEGSNWGQGLGIRGIVWTKGDISFTVRGAFTENPRITNLDLSDARKVVQVCYRLGSKPVNGKNVPPPAQPRT